MIRKHLKSSAVSSKKHEREPLVDDLGFTVHSFNNRTRPTDKRRILIISCFSEFGCETIGTMYCIPRILQMYPNFYTIVVGWHGREYLYRHLVDEYWEIAEEHQWLRDYCRAFHHVSKNLKKCEESLKDYGQVLDSGFVGMVAVGNICNGCKNFWGENERAVSCPKCQSTQVVQSILSNVQFYKPQAIKIPKPSKSLMDEASKYLGERPVGIFARGRKTYGRNLEPEFYVDLIKTLEDKGYTPIWLGEKQNTLECPVDHIVDMSRNPVSRDLELTLAIVAQLEFTVQFWTASTRLAAMMETPYLLFESPEQIFGPKGQEGIRINLVTTGNKKICISHFLSVYDDPDAGIALVKSCVEEMEDDNWEDVIGMVDSKETITALRDANLKRIGAIPDE